MVACAQEGGNPSNAILTAPTSTSQLAASTGLSGNGAPRGKHVFNWNLVGTPHAYQGNCGDGRRIFVERDAKGAQLLIKDENDGWRIEDCNATGNHQAVLHSDDLGIFDVYVRLLGKPGGRLDVCADYVSDADDALCLLGTINMTREKNSKFRLQPDSLFDAELEDILWTIDTNKDFRIAQFRVYQVTTP
jgi:hypothetical protein